MTKADETRRNDIETDMEHVALVRKAQSGDHDAFAELVRQHQRKAVSVAYRLLGNVDDASDVAQDAFVRAFRSLGQLEDPSRFGAWLMRVVTNLSLNYRRSRSIRQTSSLDSVSDDPATLRMPRSGVRLMQGPSDEDGTMPEELQDAIDAAMAELPEKQRLSLVLFSIEGMPQKEVADVLECSVELVKWNVFQARKRLKESLAAYL